MILATHLRNLSISEPNFHFFRLLKLIKVCLPIFPMARSVVEESETKPIDIFSLFPLWDLEYYKKPEIMVVTSPSNQPKKLD